MEFLILIIWNKKNNALPYPTLPPPVKSAPDAKDIHHCTYILQTSEQTLQLALTSYSNLPANRIINLFSTD